MGVLFILMVVSTDNEMLLLTILMFFFSMYSHWQLIESEENKVI